MLKNVELERNGIRNDLAAAREVTAHVVRNEDAARALEYEVVVLREHSRTQLAQLPNCLPRSREWIIWVMPALIIFSDSIVVQGKGTPQAIPRLWITC